LTAFKFGLPAMTARVAIQQASTFGRERYLGTIGRVIGMKTFGFERDHVAATAKELIEGK
jgi:transketolase